jgi:hypothetical protein
VVDKERLEQLKEMLSDAEACARLTDWEKEFLDGMREKVLTYGLHMNLSDKQEDVLSRIEEKVYV